MLYWYAYKIHVEKIIEYIFHAVSSSAVVYIDVSLPNRSIPLWWLWHTHSTHYWKQMMNQIGDTESESLTPFTTSLGELILCVAEPHNILQHGCLCLCVTIGLCVCRIILYIVCASRTPTHWTVRDPMFCWAHCKIIVLSSVISSMHSTMLRMYFESVTLLSFSYFIFSVGSSGLASLVILSVKIVYAHSEIPSLWRYFRRWRKKINRENLGKWILNSAEKHAYSSRSISTMLIRLLPPIQCLVIQCDLCDSWNQWLKLTTQGLQSFLLFSVELR